MENKEIYFDRKKNREFKILAKGKENEFFWIILSHGTHPCSYIGIPKTHPYYHLSYDEIYDKGIEIDVHGGITFNDPDFWFNPIFLDDYWFIGWDYAHSGDYNYYPDLEGMLSFRNPTDHEWTLIELQEEMKQALKDIKEVK